MGQKRDGQERPSGTSKPNVDPTHCNSKHGEGGVGAGGRALDGAPLEYRRASQENRHAYLKIRGHLSAVGVRAEAAMPQLEKQIIRVYPSLIAVVV